MSFTKSFQHSKAKLSTIDGFAQRVPVPSNYGSSVLAQYHSAGHSVLIPLSFATLTYTSVLPIGALIRKAVVLLTTPFTSGTSIEIGSILAGTDILPATLITVQSDTLVSSPFISNSSADGQTVFVTITGSPTAGAGFLLIEYINPASINGVD